MVKIAEMNEEQARMILEERANIALEMDNLDKRYPDVFCGLYLDLDHVIHVWKVAMVKQIAKVLGKEVVITPYSDDEKEKYGYLGEVYFYYEYGGQRWRVFAVYSNEKEMVG